MMRLNNKPILSFCLSFPLSCFAAHVLHGEVPIQVGVFNASQGKAQNINIVDLIGNHYTVNNHNMTNGLVGLGYFIKGYTAERYQINYGINGFYFGKAPVSGTIVQEQLFTNLSYNYSIKHLPVYLAAKAIVNNNSSRYNVTLDAGVGPNFMQVGHYSEMPLNDFSLPDNGFTANNSLAFSATAGIGLRLNNTFGKAPLECGYRFFYLGQGQLNINNTQIVNTIKTGNTYANAFICSVTA
jgi:hypothetical protein